VFRCRGLSFLASPQTRSASERSAQRPEHFAEVGGDLWIGTPRVGAPQVGERILEPAPPVQHPAHAVDDERIFGGELERLLDQVLRLGQALVAVGEGITERVVGVRILGPYLDQLAQEDSRMSTRSTFSASMGIVVEQLGIVRSAIERLADKGRTRSWTGWRRAGAALRRESTGCAAGLLFAAACCKRARASSSFALLGEHLGRSGSALERIARRRPLAHTISAPRDSPSGSAAESAGVGGEGTGAHRPCRGTGVLSKFLRYISPPRRSP